MMMCGDKPLDLVKGQSFEEKLKVWVAITPVEEAKKEAQGEFYKPIKSVDLAVGKCLGHVEKWLKKMKMNQPDEIFNTMRRGLKLVLRYGTGQQEVSTKR